MLGGPEIAVDTMGFQHEDLAVAWHCDYDCIETKVLELLNHLDTQETLQKIGIYI